MLADFDYIGWLWFKEVFPELRFKGPPLIVLKILLLEVATSTDSLVSKHLSSSPGMLE
jgi:hypothetical protein